MVASNRCDRCHTVGNGDVQLPDASLLVPAANARSRSVSERKGEIVMDATQSLTLLELEAGATEKQIRSRLFERYQAVTTKLSQLEDESKRPDLEAQLDLLNQAREILLVQAATSEDDRRRPSLSVVADNTGPSEQPHFASIPPNEFPDRVAVLLYQKAGQEGIHTLQIQDRDIVLGFESQFGARKYAQLLGQKGLPKPATEWFPTQDIVEFCEGEGYGLVIVPKDETLEPPEAASTNVDDW
ncbi:MAG: DUF3110 domain-containing protein [Cyanobacteria bacterium P01_F01_bin.33]